jgi:hypothetical protein
LYAAEKFVGSSSSDSQPVEHRGIGQLLGRFGISSGWSESPDHRIKLVGTFMSERLAALEKVLKLMGIDARVVEFRLRRVNIMNMNMSRTLDPIRVVG